MATIVFHRNKIKQRATVRLTARGRVPTFCSLLFPRWWKPVQFPRVRRGNYSKTEIVARGENGWKSDAKTFHGPFTADQLPRGNCHPLKSPHTDPISFPRFFPCTFFRYPFPREIVHVVLPRPSFHSIERINCRSIAAEWYGANLRRRTRKWHEHFAWQAYH